MDKYPDRWYEFEWDDAKRRSIFQKHGIDFEDVRQAFDGRPRIDGPGLTAGKGHETRHVSLAEVEGVVVAIVWTWRNRKIRMISVRVARRAERERFRELINGQD
jgi:uncharacterized DUF497 family protein